MLNFLYFKLIKKFKTKIKKFESKNLYLIYFYIYIYTFFLNNLFKSKFCKFLIISKF